MSEPADTDEIDPAPFFRAGAAAVEFNAPLGSRRVKAFSGQLAGADVATIVDLGCGRGRLAVVVAELLPDVSVIGIDTDGHSIDAARDWATERMVADRVRFEVADALRWDGTADVVLCVGASHAFGSPAAMFARLAEVAPQGWAVVGDGIWQSTPDSWCSETFGPLPAGLGELRTLAEAADWTVVEADLSTSAEWDEFEHRWTAGARAHGGPGAAAFADERTRQYERYRGVLGFGWLVMRR